MQPDQSPARKPRPYWHVDAKWVVGLLLSGVIIVTLVLFGLVQVTAEKPAVDTLSLTMALLLSRNGLDDETEIAEMRQRLQASPDKSIQPIPGLRLTIRESDLVNRSPRQARLAFFRQWAEPIYRNGPQGLSALADDPELRAKIVEGGAVLGLLTAETHRKLQTALALSTLACLVLLVPLVFFSDRFGRIGSPGCVLSMASLPVAAACGFIAIINPPAGAEPPKMEGMTELISQMASQLLPALAQSVVGWYVGFLAIGLGLALLAVSGNFLWWLFRKARPG